MYFLDVWPLNPHWQHIYRPIQPKQDSFYNLFHGEIEHTKLELAFHGISKTNIYCIFTITNYKKLL